MSKKDFTLIARTIAGLPLDSDDQRAAIARHFADALRDTNPNFNWSRFFLAATGRR